MERNRRNLSLAVVYALILVACSSGLGRVITVDDDGPADFRTIQAAIDDANDGDVVIVQPGTYTGDGNRDIEYRGKGITVRSKQGPRSCIVDVHGSLYEPRYGFHFRGGEDASAVLEGFTVTNGGYQSRQVGIGCDRSSPIIRNCAIVGNGGFGVTSFRSDLQISNCIIAGNREAGVLCTHGHPVLSSCTIVGNWGLGVTSGGGHRGIIRLENCIVARNSRSFGDQNLPFTQVGVGGCLAHAGCMDVELVRCCVGEEPDAVSVEAWSMPGRAHPPIADYIQTDPEFGAPGSWDPNDPAVDNRSDDFWVDGDYHLKSQAGRWDPVAESWVIDDVTSPCIDAGDPNSPVGHEPFPNGGRINIGAYGGTAEASKSWFGESICETIIAGDINGDCRVDFEDFQILASHWLRDRRPTSSEEMGAEQ